MKHRAISRYALTVICAGSALSAFPAAAQQFSADMVNHRGGADAADRAGKIYVADGKVRMEGFGGMKGGTVVMDRAAKTAYVLMPERKAYMDMGGMMGNMTAAFMPLDPDNPCPQWQTMAKESARARGDASADGTWTCKRIGTETVNGRSAIKYEGVNPKGEHQFGWIDPKLRFLIKSEGANGNGVELRNIKEEPQQASLFTVPSDYQKLDMNQMMQQMRQQHGGAKPPG